MNHLHLPTLSLLLVLSFASVLRADPSPQLVAVLEAAQTSRHPFLTFYQGLADLDDGAIERDAIQEALAASGLDPASSLYRSIDPVVRLEKDGERVAVDYGERVFLEAGDGEAVTLVDHRSTFRLRRDGARAVVMDDIDGIKVGQTRHNLYHLKKLVYDYDGERPVARVTAGVLFFTRTVTIDMTPGVSGIAAAVAAAGGE